MDELRVTVEGRALATLIFAEWLQLQGHPIRRGLPTVAVSEGAVDVYSEMAQLVVSLPCEVMYAMVADPPPTRATLRRVGPEEPLGGATHVATYLLRLEVG